MNNNELKQQYDLGFITAEQMIKQIALNFNLRVKIPKNTAEELADNLIDAGDFNKNEFKLILTDHYQKYQ